MKISIIVPSIRLDNWNRLYDTISKSCSRYDFELILIGPKNKEDFVKDNVVFIQSRMSPNACQQLGLLSATGDIVTWASDDCIFVEGMIDKYIDQILTDRDKKHVVVGKYTEGVDSPESNCLFDSYYQLNASYPNCSSIPDHWVHFNTAIMYMDYFLELGGFECRFQVPAFAFADIAVRAQRDGAKITFVQDKLLHCEHGQPDHMPIEIAHVYEDTPLYRYLHNNEPERVRIPLDNWKSQPEIWNKREFTI